MAAKHLAAALCVALVVNFLAVGPGPNVFGQQPGEWRSYGGDPGSMKYSALDQINMDNVGKVQVAWTWESPDVALQKTNRGLGSFAHEYTPLAIGNTLYTSTSVSQVAAIDGRTGEQLWVFNPEAYKAGRPTNLGFVHRGVAYWTDGTVERLFLAAHDAFLYAIDAKTGKAVSEFGEGGRVNLAQAIPLAQAPRNYTMTSPPVVCRDVVVVGSSISDGPQTKEAPRGDIQGFDVRTGKPSWIFHTVPQAGEFGNETWKKDSWKYTGNTNVWTLTLDLGGCIALAHRLAHATSVFLAVYACSLVGIATLARPRTSRRTSCQRNPSVRAAR